MRASLVEAAIDIVRHEEWTLAVIIRFADRPPVTTSDQKVHGGTGEFSSACRGVPQV